MAQKEKLRKLWYNMQPKARKGLFQVHTRLTLACLAISAVACVGTADAQLDGFDGWSPKFYHGLESNGSVRTVLDGCRGVAPCIALKHIDGAQKFGAAKDVKPSVEGPVEWKVSADVWCGADGEAGVSMEFFGAKGGTLGVIDGEGIRP